MSDQHGPHQEQNTKYKATIDRMTEALALTYWGRLIRPEDQKAAWIQCTKMYWEGMAIIAYHAKHKEKEDGGT